MALGGTYQDHYKEMFKDILLMESQQKGSLLEAVTTMEMMEGNKTYFDKLGSVDTHAKTSRNMPKVFADANFERRPVISQFNSFNHQIDREDLIKYVNNPKNEITKAAVMAMGRKKDKIIMDAIKGNAVVQTDGSASNQALTLSVDVNDHQFDDGSGDVGLTSSKLKLAKTLIMENYGFDVNEKLICIAPARQIMNLTKENQQVSGDFRTSRPLESPGVITSLSGFMGIDFIAYEGTGVDSNDDELVYLLTEDAVKLGIFQPLVVEVDRNVQSEGNPDILSVFEQIGATRLYEEKVVEIACDPLA